MDHMNQEPLDFAAALALLREARAEITRLREHVGEIPGLKLALEHVRAQHVVWDKTELNAWALLSRLESGIQALIDNRRGISPRTP